MNPYNYKNSHIRANLNLKSENSHYSCYRVDFPSAFEACHVGNTNVLGDYYQPQNAEKAPLVILVHGMGNYGAMPCHWLARNLVKKGFASFVLYQLFHSNRVPENIRNRLLDLNADEWFESYQISVIDVRQIIDWAGNKAEIDGDKIAVIGISFGGFTQNCWGATRLLVI